MLNSKRTDYLFAAIVTIFMGHSIILIKSLLFVVDPLGLTYVRVVITALTLILFSFFCFGIVLPKGKEWIYLFITSCFGVFLHQMTLALGLELSQATNGALIMGLNPLTTSLFASFILKESLGVKQYVGLLLGFTGIFVIMFEGFSTVSFSPGDIWLVLAMGTQAISFIYLTKLSDHMHVVHINMYSYLFGAIMLSCIPVFRDMAFVYTISIDIWAKIFVSSSIFTALGFIGWNICLKRLGAGQASIFLNIITVTTVLGSVIYLGETLLVQHILGFLFISTGIWISTQVKRSQIEKKSKSISIS